MGVERIFFLGVPLGDFSKALLGGAKFGEICFFTLLTKKTTFFAEIFKMQGFQNAGPRPPISPF